MQSGVARAGNLQSQILNLNYQSLMEYWEVTLNRAQQTLPVWVQHFTELTIGEATSDSLSDLMDGFEPLVQARVAAQDVFDAAFRARQAALATMRVLGTRVPEIIDGQLRENEGLMKDLKDVYKAQPRDESSILKRLRLLLPVWVRANTALAGMGGGMAPVTRTVGGVLYTVALAQTLLDGFTEVVKAQSDKLELLDSARADLRAHDKECDDLNKRFYKVAKAMSDEGSPGMEALLGITVEPSTPAPETVEIDHITQGGEDGLQALVAYVPGGGAHATSKRVLWKVEGVDAEFQQAALDFSGNALGPFAVGQVVKIYTEVENSVGVRSTAVRTMTVEVPIL